jgi:CBS-domain-containing membrane protein
MSDSTNYPPKLVRDLMSVGVLTCPPDTTAIDLARLFLEKEVEAVIVLDDQGHAVGTVGRDELVRAYAHADYQELTAEAVMRDGVVQAPPDIPLTAAAQIMQDHGVRALFLMHHAGGIEYPAAMLTYSHFLRHMAAADEEELRDLGIKAEREPPLVTFLRRRDEARRQHDARGARREE